MIRLPIKVTPNAKKTEIIGWEGEGGKVLRVRLNAPPVDGKANQELVRFLAKRLGLSKSAVTIARGEKSRDKVLEIAVEWGEEELRRKLGD